jgi:hypothetical protein
MRPGSEVSNVLSSLDFETLLTHTEGVVSCDIADETVILNVTSGIYFGLDNVGASIWAILDTPTSVGDVCSRLTKEYDVDAVECAEAVIRFTRHMAERGLVTVIE